MQYGKGDGGIINGTLERPELEANKKTAKWKKSITCGTCCGVRVLEIVHQEMNVLLLFPNTYVVLNQSDSCAEHNGIYQVKCKLLITPYDERGKGTTGVTFHLKKHCVLYILLSVLPCSTESIRVSGKHVNK